MTSQLEASATIWWTRTASSTRAAASPKPCSPASRRASSASTGTGTSRFVNRSAARLLDVAPEEIEGRHYSRSRCPSWRALIRRAMVEPAGRAAGRSSTSGATARRAISTCRSSSEARRQDRLRRHLRRHHRSGLRAAHRRLGRRRPPHRARDQEPADARSSSRPSGCSANMPARSSSDPEVFAAMHRHHHPPGRRHRPHGRRVLLLRAHAGAGDAPRESRRNCCARPCSCSASPTRRSPSSVTAPTDPVHFECDGRLVSQALTNVLKNAARGASPRASPRATTTPGRIAIDAAGSRHNRVA